MSDELRATEGLERIFTLRDTTDGQVIVVWRDKEAADAARAASEARWAKAATLGVAVTPGQFYDSFAEL